MPVSTDTYIRNFNAQHNQCSFTKLVHDHNTAVQVIQVALVILAAVVFVCTPWTVAFCGVAVAVISDLSAAVTLLASVASWLFIHFGTCQHHNVTEHVFEPAECKDATLEYLGHTPVLRIKTANPYNAGKAHGYLLGKQIYNLWWNVDVSLHTLYGLPRAAELPRVMQEMKRAIPMHYLEEMRGLADGYNQWAQENDIDSHMTIDDVILIHLLPDSKHFHPGEVEQHLAHPQQPVQAPAAQMPTTSACTVIMQRDQQAGIVMGRNMEWWPFGNGGTNTLVIVWEDSGVATYGMPGMIGVVTGWNKAGLCMSINVCPGQTHEVRGKPAIINIRDMLTQARDVRDVEARIFQNPVLGAHHDSVCDARGEAACFSFYQGAQEQHTVRKIQGIQPLITVNWCYPDCTGGYFNSQGRMALLNPYFQNAPSHIWAHDMDSRKLVTNALKLTPLVNSWITTHSLVLLPQKDEIELGADNGFAADQPRQKHRMSGFFTQSAVAKR